MTDIFRNLDHSVFHLINQSLSAEWLDPLMIVLSSKWVWIPFYVLIGFLFIKKYRLQSWIVFLLAVIVISLSDSVSSKVIKPGVKRLRPNHAMNNVRMPDKNDGHSKYGFVSSHAANAFAVFVFSGLFLGLKRRHFMLLMMIPLLISYSRVYLGVHYPADILGGGMVGTFFSILAFWAYGKCMLMMKKQEED